MYAHIQRHTRWASALLHNSSYAEGRGWLVRLILRILLYSNTRDGRVHCCTTVVTRRVGAGL